VHHDRDRNAGHGTPARVGRTTDLEAHRLIWRYSLATSQALSLAAAAAKQNKPVSTIW
jgi:hypothetical protein